MLIRHRTSQQVKKRREDNGKEKGMYGQETKVKKYVDARKTRKQKRL